MPLIIDDAAEADYYQIIRDLRATRIQADRSQGSVADCIHVRTQTVCEWETGVTQPALDHLIQWAGELRRRLVVVDQDGKLRPGPRDQRPGESWERFERRRLAWPLKNRRVALGLPQERLGRLVGVTRASIQRWELAQVPPRPKAITVWARRLGYSLSLVPTGRHLESIPRTPVQHCRCCRNAMQGI